MITFFKKIKQKKEIVYRMAYYVLNRIPKKGIKKIEESKKEYRIHFNSGYEISDDDFIKLADYAESFPNKKYNQIKKVIVGMTSNASIYFKVE